MRGVWRRLALGGGLAATAAASPAVAETLQDAWSLAAAHDPVLAAAAGDVESARADLRAAGAARWPTVAASAGYTRLSPSPALEVVTPDGMTLQSGALFKDNQMVSGGVQMRLPLYAGGQITAGIDAARATQEAAEAGERATAATVRLAVAEDYVAVLRARHTLTAAQAAVDSLTAHLTDAQRLVDSGTVPRSDLLAARVALADATQARLRAANGVELALAAYNRRLGEPMDRSPDLDEHPAAPGLSAGEPLDVLITRALGARGELKGLAASADALSSQSRAERGRLLPQVALTGAYTHLDNQFLDRDSFASVGIGVTWTLFDGGQARDRAAALKSASRAQTSRLEDLRSQIALAVRQHWLGVREAQARVAASGEAVAQATENLRLSRELYGAGMGTNTQVLEAVTLHIQAQNNRDNAQLDEMLARLRLAHAVGAL